MNSWRYGFTLVTTTNALLAQHESQLVASKSSTKKRFELDVHVTQPHAGACSHTSLDTSEQVGKNCTCTVCTDYHRTIQTSNLLSTTLSTISARMAHQHAATAPRALLWPSRHTAIINIWNSTSSTHWRKVVHVKTLKRLPTPCVVPPLYRRAWSCWVAHACAARFSQRMLLTLVTLRLPVEIFTYWWWDDVMMIFAYCQWQKMIHYKSLQTIINYL